MRSSEPLYKIGDVVTILTSRRGEPSDYIGGFVDEMVQKFGGRKFRIYDVEASGCSPRKYSPEANPAYYYLKTLDGGRISWTWSAEMFQESYHSKCKPPVISEEKPEVRLKINSKVKISFKFKV